MQAFLKTGKLDKSSVGSSGSSGNPKTQSKKKTAAPWVEKYRPKSIDDIVDQNEVVQVLRECLSGGDLPHLLFYGPPGTGKTSAILAAARQLFGDLLKERVLELNASDERGIQVVREKVKNFSQLTVSSVRPDGRACPPFKLVILDEADSMTGPAQAALRRTMERETRSTRFCLICNYVSRIIPPITSRCSKFRFKPLSIDTAVKRLREVCTSEGVECEQELLEQAVHTCEGDLRRALTALQCCQRLKSCVTIDGLVEVTGMVPEKLVNEYLAVKNYTELEKFVEEFLLNAYSASQFLEQLSATVVSAGHLTNKQKCSICDKLAVCAHRLLEGGAEMMQLTDLGCTIIMANNNP